jgi:hypothetical protein
VQREHELPVALPLSEREPAPSIDVVWSVSGGVEAVALDAEQRPRTEKTMTVAVLV